MSLKYHICFIVLLVCQYGSLEDSGEEVSQEQEIKEDKDKEEDGFNPRSVQSDASIFHPELDPKTPATYYWPHGIVPYIINTRHYDDIIVERIRAAMVGIESVSCVRFKHLVEFPNWTTRNTWLAIENPDKIMSCVHNTLKGYLTKAILVIGYDCVSKAEIMHSLLHALGFNDEVTHPQRDQYIRIQWQNIQPKYHPLFRVSPSNVPVKTMVEYDPLSVMHFHDRAYSINGAAIITPLIPGLIINPTEKLSLLDVARLRLAFGHECNRRKVGNLLETCQNVFQTSKGDKSSPKTEEATEDSSEYVRTEEKDYSDNIDPIELLRANASRIKRRD